MKHPHRSTGRRGARLIRHGALLALALAFAAGAAAQDRAPAAPDKGAVEIIPDQFLRGFDPVTVHYRSPVARDAKSPTGGAGPWLSVSPAVKGEYRWLDAQTVQFLPAQPWPALSRIRVAVRGGEKLLSTLMVPPSDIEPAPGSRGLGPIEAVRLTFPGAFDAAAVKSMLSLEIRDLPGLQAAGAKHLSPGDFELREIERLRSARSSSFQLKLAVPVPWGKRLIVRLRLAADESIPGSLASYSFDTRGEFRLVAMGNRSALLPVSAAGAGYDQRQILDCGTDASALVLEFSDDPAPFGAETLKRLVRFEPAVRNLRHNFAGNRLYLEFEADRERPYRLSVNWQALRTAGGQTLSKFGACSFWFYYRQAEPFLSWRQSAGILERYGPQTLPMEGRGTGRVDLRIHKVDPESLDYWPFPDNAPSVAENSRPPMAGQEPAYGYDLVGHIRLLPSPQVSRIVRLPVGEGSPRSVFGLDIQADLAAKFGAGSPGTYLVGYRQLGAGDQRYYQRVTVTDLCLSTVSEEGAAVFAVSSLKTGLPLPGVELRLERVSDGDGRGKSVDLLYRGATDAQGRLRLERELPLRWNPSRVVLRLGDDVLVLDCDKAPPSFAANHWSSGGGWLGWLAADRRDLRHRAATHAWMVAERPVYRPDETVHLLAFVRDAKDGEFLPSPGRRGAEIRVVCGDKEWKYPVAESKYGRFQFDFKPEEEATGAFAAELRDAVTGQVLATARFQREAYRVPQFEVDLHAEGKVPLDRPFTVTLTASYYAGGRVVGERVDWKVTQLPYQIASPGLAGFAFARDPRTDGQALGADGAMNANGVLDGEGSHRLTIDPTKERDGQARRYLFEATVRGADRQTVTQSCQVVALPPFSVGVKLPRLSGEGLVLRPQVIAVDHLERPKAGVPMTVRLLQREWHSYIADTDLTTGNPKYVTDVVDKAVAERSVVSAAGATTVEFPLKEAGVYLVEVSTKDQLGRRVSVGADSFVSGGKAMAWERKREGLFEISLDKEVYDPGSTAKLLFKSPYQNAGALVVVEHPLGNRYHWVPVAKGQGSFELPIDERMNPGVPVTVLLQRGRSAPFPAAGDDGQGLDLGKPNSVAASIVVPVSPRAHQAWISLVHPAKARPGDKLPLDIGLTTPDGAALDGEVALWLVDKAVLSLGRESSINPLPAFIDPARSWIALHDTRNLTVGGVPVMETPGGDGDEEAAAPDQLDRQTVRKNFQTVPYYKADIEVKGGKAHVDVPLPDNLTDFALRAVAVSGYNRFGYGKSSLSVRLPLLVQPALPRFVRAGDSFRAGGLARVFEGADGPAQAVVKADGLDLGPGAGPAYQGDPRSAQVDFKLEGGKASKLLFPLAAPLDALAGGRREVGVELSVRRQADGARDALAVKLPLRSDTIDKSWGQSGTLAAGAAAALDQPGEAFRTGSLRRSLTLYADPALSGAIGALRALAVYPHGCVEQQVSQLYPSVALRELYAAAGLAPADKGLAAVFGKLMAYIASAQDGDGLIGYWPGSRGYVNLTAYVVDFLATAGQAGLPVDGQVQKRALAALRDAMGSDSRLVLPNYGDWERVEALAAQARAGGFSESAAVALLERSAGMQPYSQARLLATLADRRLAGSAKAKALAARVEAWVFTKLEGGREVFAGLQDKSLPWGGLVMSSETKTVAAMVEALAKAKPESKVLPLLEDWLVGRAKGWGWGSTQDNVWALRALNAVVASRAARNGDLAVTLADAAGKKRELGLKGKLMLTVALDGDGAYSLSGLRGAGAKQGLAFELSGDYTPAARGSALAASNAGYAVERWIQPVGGDGAVAAVRSGAAIELRLDQVAEESVRLHNFRDRNFVAVTVPLAAGMEPLNPALANAPPEATPSREPTRAPDYAMFLDDRVVYYYDALPKGDYEFRFRTRAGFAGAFTLPPAQAESMYEPGARGNSDACVLRVAGE